MTAGCILNAGRILEERERSIGRIGVARGVRK
jgi:hypothetical protein